MTKQLQNSILKATKVEDYSPFRLNKLYKITNIEEKKDTIIVTVDNRIDFKYTSSEIANYFEIISMSDIEEMDVKVFAIKQAYNELKKQNPHFPKDVLIFDSIQELVQTQNFNAEELQFIAREVEIEDIEQCSCCGKILMPDDECYSDELHDDDAALCDHCSVFNEETDMYQKVVNQDVIEQLTGLKFSPHMGNVGSKIEEFNFWLNIENHKFDFQQTDNRDTLVEFINEYTEWNICDCCGLIEVSSDLFWDSSDACDDDYTNFRFLQGSMVSFDAVCQDCLNKAGMITHSCIEDIALRLKENKMKHKVFDIVLLENVKFKKRNIPQTTVIGEIKSMNLDKKTYTLKEFGNTEFTDEDFYDILNEAYVNEYADFISDNYPSISDRVDEWSYPNCEGHPEIDYAFEEFGYKDEFIEHLKSKDLPYGRFLEPKFNIGDKFNVSFSHYEDGEITEHVISKIDKSFNEADEIVYWSDDLVYITESELEKQKNNVIELVRDGMNRIEFSNSLQDLIVGNGDDGENIYFYSLSNDEKIYYLQAIIEDYKENK